MKLLKGLGLKSVFLHNEPLRRHTTFRIGGPVKIWAEPQDLNDLQILLDIAKGEGFSIFLVGEGSNLLVSDEGLDVMAISLKSAFDFWTIREEKVVCGAGRSLQRFIHETMEAGYSGLEFMAGIPASVGGAVRMNAGAGKNGPWLSDLIENVKVCDFNGSVRFIEKKDLVFGYRDSNLKDFIVLEAEFSLKKGSDKNIAKKNYEESLTKKRDKQELLIPSAGCIFKNPQDSELTAGQLIEGCGLKGKRMEDAMISTRHANFIVNLRRATFQDVMALIDLIRDTVFKKYGIVLDLEIQILQ